MPTDLASPSLSRAYSSAWRMRTSLHTEFGSVVFISIICTGPPKVFRVKFLSLCNCWAPTRATWSVPSICPACRAMVMVLGSPNTWI